MKLLKRISLVIAIVLMTLLVHPEHVHAATITCNYCGQTFSAEPVFGGDQPNCMNPVMGLLYCTNCGVANDYMVQPSPAYHEYVFMDSTNPGCTNAGQEREQCIYCGDVRTKTLNALGHNYSTTLNTDATCVSNGSSTSTCSRCGNVRNNTIPALGHNYQVTNTVAATCTKNGKKEYSCTRCGDGYSEIIYSKGHDYKEVETKPNCTEDGEITYTCKKCNHSYTKVLEATGHDYEEKEKVDPTCTEDGYTLSICSKCDDELKEIQKAFGHKYKTEVIKEATCEEDGESKLTCSECGDETTEIIPALGHKYPEEWTVVKKPTYFKEGLEDKTCATCKTVLEEPIDKLPPTVPIAVGSVAVAGLGAYAYMLKKKRRIRFVKPILDSRAVLLCIPEGEYKDELLECFKAKHFLEVTQCEKEALEDAIKENDPDLVVLYSDDYNETVDTIENIDGDYAIIFDSAMYKDHKEEIKALKKEGKIKSYIPSSLEGNVALITLVLPLYKPDLKRDESIEYIGALADAFGIPLVSTITDLVVTGKDLKSELETEDKGVVDAAIIIEDIANILGLDTIATIAGLIDSADTIISAFDKEAGAYETKEGISSAADVLDTIKEIL